MIDDALLDQAVRQAIVTPQQAAQLRALAAGGSPLAGPAPDAEQLRFISGFADIFVTIGIFLFLGGLIYLLAETFPDSANKTSMIAGAVAAASWLLAEVFARRLRMALPSIVLLLTFAFGVTAAVAALFVTDLDQTRMLALRFGLGMSMPPPALLASSAATGLALAAHYRRFGVPITLAAGGVMLTALVVSLIGLAAPDVLAALQRPITLMCGLAFFAAAMQFDRRDLRRVTRASDIAFWLHMLAASLIVHSLVGVFAGGFMLTTTAALLVIVLFVALGLVAIVIDRRAMLVSGLIYLGIAFSSLLRESGSVGLIAPLTIFGLGAFMLTISAFWQPLRAAILARLPPGVTAWAPPARRRAAP